MFTTAAIATPFNPLSKAFCDRLVAAGKTQKLAPTARARKLRTILNTKTQARKPSNEELHLARIQYTCLKSGSSERNIALDSGPAHQATVPVVELGGTVHR